MISHAIAFFVSKLSSFVFTGNALVIQGEASAYNRRLISPKIIKNILKHSYRLFFEFIASYWVVIDQLK